MDPDTKKLVNTALSVQIDDKAPEFITKPKRQFIDEGDTARFKASFEGSTDTVISWSFNGKTISKDDRHKVELSPFHHFPAFFSKPIALTLILLIAKNVAISISS